MNGTCMLLPGGVPLIALALTTDRVNRRRSAIPLQAQPAAYGWTRRSHEPGLPPADRRIAEGRQTARPGTAVNAIPFEVGQQPPANAPQAAASSS